MIIDLNSAHLRIILRVYFIVVTALIGFLGNTCCGFRAQLTIAHHHHVTLSKMTGWLKGSDLLSLGWKLRTIPGGWIGLAMMLVTAVDMISDLAVAGLVKTISVPSRCDFGTGIVIDETSGSILRPSPNGAPSSIAAQAQVTSANNAGLEGIYRKVNNATSFRADQQDILGAWVCADQGTITFDASYSPRRIADALYSKGYLYTRLPAHEVTTYSTSPNFFNATGHFEHLVLWDTSQGTNSGKTFDVRVAIDKTPQMNGKTEMWIFRCAMDAIDAEFITRGMASQLVLGSWAAYLQGSIYNGVGTTAWPETGRIISRLLNTMTMVAGSLNSVQSFPSSSSYTDTTQGCLTSKAIIPTIVIAMGLVLAIILFLLICFCLYLKISLLSGIDAQKTDVNLKKLIAETPNDLVDWMTHAIRETASGTRVHATTVKIWRFGTDGRECRLFEPTGPIQNAQHGQFSQSGGAIEFGHRRTYSRIEEP